MTKKQLIDTLQAEYNKTQWQFASLVVDRKLNSKMSLAGKSTAERSALVTKFDDIQQEVAFKMEAIKDVINELQNDELQIPGIET